jgi:hypothetical protein
MRDVDWGFGHHHRWACVSLFALLLGTACGDDAAPPVGDSGHTCTGDPECDDGVFCNGAERCEPGPAADARGCRAGDDPCMPSQDCNETDRCVTDCVAPDADGDGQDAESCGGDDCDDADSNRFPGNDEVCDTEQHDEDCDPATFGVRDGDGDGFPDDRCCNLDEAGNPSCGSDCDDAAGAIHPTESESCNTLDDDCDEMVDEGTGMTFWTDADGDGRASDAPDTAMMLACTAPAGFAAARGDCDDGNPSIATGLPELCDGLALDEDCDTSIDEGVRADCYADADDDTYAASGAVVMMVCRDATRMAVGGCPVMFTNRAPTGAGNTDCDDAMLAVSPAAAESCNGRDDDCDGTIDDGFFCAAGVSRACMGSAGCGSLAGSQRCAPDCSAWSPCALPDEGPTVAGTCNGCDDDLDGVTDDHFACVLGTSMPGCTTTCGTTGNRMCLADCDFDACRATEACNYCDDDGDALLRSDELPSVLPTQSLAFAPLGTASTVLTDFAVLGAAYLSSGTASSIAAVELTRDVRVGYGTITFTANPNAIGFGTMTPATGWAIWMYRVGSGTTVPAASTFGAPSNRNGWVGKWAFRGATIDDAILGVLRVSATDPDLDSGTVSGGSLNTPVSVAQALRLVVTPDNPDTAANETRVELYAGDSTTTMSREGLCDTSDGTDCMHTIRPGEVWRFGVSHVAGAAGSVTSLQLRGDSTTVVLSDACLLP